MPRLFDACNKESQSRLKAIALEMGMLDYNPQLEVTKCDVKVEAKLEPIEEIAFIASQKPLSHNELKE